MHGLNHQVAMPYLSVQLHWFPIYVSIVGSHHAHGPYVNPPYTQPWVVLYIAQVSMVGPTIEIFLSTILIKVADVYRLQSSCGALYVARVYIKSIVLRNSFSILGKKGVKTFSSLFHCKCELSSPIQL